MENIVYKDDYTIEPLNVHNDLKYIREIQFSHWFSDERKEKNGKLADTMTREEWSKHCDDSVKRGAKMIDDFLEYLGARYTIYQYNTTDYKKDYTYFAYRTENKDTLTLTFNHKRPIKDIIYDMENLVRIVEEFEDYEYFGDDEDISVWVKLNSIEELISLKTEIGME